MAKLNYSKFQDKGTEVIPADQVEVIPASKVEVLPAPNQYDVSTGNQGGGLGQSLANAASPVAAICDCVKVALGTIEVISKCVAAVSIEKQKTEQVKAMYTAQMMESKEQTARIKAQEKEETKRLKITCENNLKLQKGELQKLSMELESKEKSMILSHKEYMTNINFLQKALDEITDTKRRVYLLINQCDEDKETIEMYLHSLHVADEKLVEIAKQVSSMKGV